MTGDEEYLSVLLSQRENRRLEFKEARTSFSLDEIYKYVVGIGNAGGGIILLGINDKGEVVGSLAFRDPDSLEHHVHKKIGVRILTRELQTEGMRVLSIQIPSRQRGTPLSIDGRYFLRTGESLVTMTPHQLREIFDEGDRPPAARSVTEQIGLETVFELLEVDTYFQLVGINPPSSALEKLRVLSSAYLITEEEYGLYSITASGALFLAKDLKSFPELEWRRVRFLKYAGTSRLHAVVDHFETRGYGVGFESMMDLIRSHTATAEEISGSHRKERPRYHPTAVREFLANALVHQDLTVDGLQITVEVFDDRIEIRNPGIPLIDVTRFVDEARTRNRELADAMRLARLCEARGSGVDRALTFMEGDLLPAPEFRAENDATSVVLYAERTFEDMTQPERIWATFLHSCVRHVATEALTNSSLRTRFGLSPSKSTLVSNTITASVEQGLIKLDPRVGASRRHARYLPFFA